MKLRKSPPVTVVVVNGEPRAGKDTFINNVSAMLRSRRVPVDSFSSIDPVREMLQGAGFDLDAKTEADRKLLAVIGDAVQEHSNWRTNKCIEQIDWFRWNNHRKGVFFLHIREPKNIALVQAGLAQGISMITVFIESTRSHKIMSNAADAGVRNMKYHHVIQNNGTLGDFSNAAARFVSDVLLRSNTSAD